MSFLPALSFIFFTSIHAVANTSERHVPSLQAKVYQFGFTLATTPSLTRDSTAASRLGYGLYGVDTHQNDFTFDLVGTFDDGEVVVEDMRDTYFVDNFSS